MKLNRSYSYLLLGMDEKCEVVKVLKKKRTTSSGDCDSKNNLSELAQNAIDEILLLPIVIFAT